MNLRKYITPPLVGYLILAGGVGYAVDRSFTHSDDVKSATYTVLVKGCDSGNDLRTTLQHIIINPQAVAQEKVLVKEGRFSQKDLNRAIKLAHKEAKTVAPRDCSRAYHSLKP